VPTYLYAGNDEDLREVDRLRKLIGHDKARPTDEVYGLKGSSVTVPAPDSPAGFRKVVD
jgi:hypothetical protein